MSRVLTRIQTEQPLLSSSADQLQPSPVASMQRGGVCRLCRPRRRSLLLLLLLLVMSAALYLIYVCPPAVCLRRPSLKPQLPAVRAAGGRVSFEQLRRSGRPFSQRHSDVIVFVHIQKTGGTVFGKHLVKNLLVDRPCECAKIDGRTRCRCVRPGGNGLWLFARHSTGWRCGVHAGWTELVDCVEPAMDKLERQAVLRRYFYVTFLREPMERYLSEWRHVQRGATWRRARNWCADRAATTMEIPACYTGEDWSDVTLDEFLECDSNLAGDRQTRMLADLRLINCYRDLFNKSTSAAARSRRDQVLLESAKRNLRQLVFFGLTERQSDSQWLFEQTFGMRFARPFEEHTNDSVAAEVMDDVSEMQLRRIRHRNRLDMQLYSYAKQLMRQRLQQLQERHL